MIKITMRNSQAIVWNKEEYDDYLYDGKCFIVIKNKEWVGIYNMDCVVSIICK